MILFCDFACKIQDLVLQPSRSAFVRVPPGELGLTGVKFQMVPPSGEKGRGPQSRWGGGRGRLGVGKDQDLGLNEH